MFSQGIPRTPCFLNLPFLNCRSSEELSVVGPKLEFKTQDDLALWVYWKVRSVEKSVGYKLRSLNQKRGERREARCWGPRGIGTSLLLKLHGPKHMLLCRQHIRKDAKVAVWEAAHRSQVFAGRRVGMGELKGIESGV